MMDVRVWHVTMDDGAVYGVAAAGKRDALDRVTARTLRDEHPCAPVKAERMSGKLPATWHYGLTLRYT